MNSRSAADRSDSKVARMSDKYGLSGIDEELETRWTRADDRYSLRQLATYFNQRLLRAAMARSGMNPLAGETENLYELLTAEDTSEGVRIQARKRLEQHGIAAEDLLDDFVSYQTINRYLKRLGAERESTVRTADERRKDRAQRVYALQNRTAAVTQRTLEEARSAGDLSLGDVDVFIDITVTCRDCGTHAPARELFKQGGCRCSETE